MAPLLGQLPPNLMTYLTQTGQFNSHPQHMLTKGEGSPRVRSFVRSKPILARTPHCTVGIHHPTSDSKLTRKRSITKSTIPNLFPNLVIDFSVQSQARIEILAKLINIIIGKIDLSTKFNSYLNPTKIIRKTTIKPQLK